jgi:hypothetical protein
MTELGYPPSLAHEACVVVPRVGPQYPHLPHGYSLSHSIWFQTRFIPLIETGLMLVSLFVCLTFPVESVSGVEPIVYQDYQDYRSYRRPRDEQPDH